MTGSILPVAAGLASLAFSFYALVPLAIRRTMTMDLRKISLRPPMYLLETDPETGEALEVENAPDDDHYLYADYAAELTPLGFVEVAQYTMAILDNVPTTCALFFNSNQNALALASVMRPKNMAVKHHLEFVTRFDDHHEIATANAPDLGFPIDLPGKAILYIPWIDDAATLWKLHQARVADESPQGLQRPLAADGSHESVLVDDMTRELDARVDQGFWVRPRAEIPVFHAKLQTAYIGTWGELPPVKQIRVFINRRRARRYVDRLLGQQ